MKFLSRLFGAVAEADLVDRMVFHPSETCLECGTNLARPAEARNEADWRCPNLDCPERLRERLAHWCSAEALNIAGMDAALIAQLVKQGLVCDVAELYSLKRSELAALPGRDLDFAKSCWEEIVASKAREGWRVLHGLGIPQVDAQTARLLCQHFAAVDDLLAAGPERIVSQTGVSESVARSIAHWYSDSVNRRLVRRLRKAGVNFNTP
jgi:DNA ligase (NAD+)